MVATKVVMKVVMTVVTRVARMAGMLVYKMVVL